MAESNAAMAHFLHLAMNAPSPDALLPDALRDQVRNALAQAEQAAPSDLAALDAAGCALKSALSGFIEAREQGAMGDADLAEALRTCLRQVAQHEQAVALRAGGMTPF